MEQIIDKNFVKQAIKSGNKEAIIKALATYWKTTPTTFQIAQRLFEQPQVDPLTT